MPNVRVIQRTLTASLKAPSKCCCLVQQVEGKMTKPETNTGQYISFIK